MDAASCPEAPAVLYDSLASSDIEGRRMRHFNLIYVYSGSKIKTSVQTTEGLNKGEIRPSEAPVPNLWHM